MCIKKFFTSILLMGIAIANAQNSITTFVGTGSPGFTGDGGIGTSATIYNPCQVVFNKGYIYFTQRSNNTIRRVSTTSGIISTFVSVANFNSNGSGIAFDKSGNMYVAETHTIVKYDATGAFLDTIAGAALSPGYSGDGGPAKLGRLNSPLGLSYDTVRNYLYIAEQNNNVFRKIDFSVATPTISTFAGTKGTSDLVFNASSATDTHFKQPSSVVVDQTTGDVYMTGYITYAVYVSNFAGNNLSKVAGGNFVAAGQVASQGDGGPANNAVFLTGSALAIYGNNLYLLDGSYHHVRQIILSTGIISNYAGHDTASIGKYGGDNGNASVLASSGATEAIINVPAGIALDDKGYLYITERFSSRIRRVLPTTVLPLSLTSFTASLINKAAELNWKTSNEVNVDGFVVEKSFNGLNFSPIGNISSKNSPSATYSFTDNQIKNSFNYYRLKLEDKDGSFKYSSVIVIKNNADAINLELSIFPNPVTNNITINHSKADDDAIIKIISITGKSIAQYTVAKNATQTSLDVSQLLVGQYIVL